jgi:protein-S-isoprenylcysteine O-methyltransferase Ste14
MSDEPKQQSRSWIIGSPILLGTTVGFIIAMLHPESLEFSVACGLGGALIGLAAGLLIWLWRSAA